MAGEVRFGGLRFESSADRKQFEQRVLGKNTKPNDAQSRVELTAALKAWAGVDLTVSTEEYAKFFESADAWYSKHAIFNETLNFEGGWEGFAAVSVEARASSGLPDEPAVDPRQQGSGRRGDPRQQGPGGRVDQRRQEDCDRSRECGPGGARPSFEGFRAGVNNALAGEEYEGGQYVRVSSSEQSGIVATFKLLSRSDKCRALDLLLAKGLPGVFRDAVAADGDSTVSIEGFRKGVDAFRSDEEYEGGQYVTFSYTEKRALRDAYRRLAPGCEGLAIDYLNQVGYPELIPFVTG